MLKHRLEFLFLLTIAPLIFSLNMDMTFDLEPLNSAEDALTSMKEQIQQGSNVNKLLFYTEQRI